MIISIDPDISKSGIAILNKDKKIVWTGVIKFFDLIDLLQSQKNRIQEVYIEAGWLNKKANYHGIQGTRGEKISYRVGQNHLIGKMLRDFCELNSIKAILIKPQNSKMGQKDIEQIIKCKINLNQDARDALAILIRQLGLYTDFKLGKLKVNKNDFKEFDEL